MTPAQESVILRMSREEWLLDLTIQPEDKDFFYLQRGNKWRMVFPDGSVGRTWRPPVKKRKSST